MTKLIGALRDYSNAPENVFLFNECMICGLVHDVISSPRHTASDKKINLKGTGTA
jgi:hypothetical protein